MKKHKIHKKGNITSLYAIASKCFGIISYRGYAPLSVLSRISMADEYDQVDNPAGTQRELNKRHAKDVYEYAKNSRNSKALWPEIILNIRKKDAVKIQSKGKSKGPKSSGIDMVKIQLVWGKIDEYKNSKEIAISRVDGNHRLYYAGGEINDKQFPRLSDIQSPFCIMWDISKADELRIFRDVNFEQKHLNTSHLYRIQTQTLTPDELWTDNKGLWLTNRLSQDTKSPFYTLVHKGGRKKRGQVYLIKQKSLLYAINKLLQKFPDHEVITDRDKLLLAIINYFNAIKSIWPKEWKDTKKYRLMSGTGLIAFGIVGGRLMSLLFHASGKLREEDFKKKLIQLRRRKSDFWRRDSPHLEGRTGRPGAEKIAEDIMELINAIGDSGLEV
ncbi:MAG: DGQHR domain-containing protein [bacterium]